MPVDLLKKMQLRGQERFAPPTSYIDETYHPALAARFSARSKDGALLADVCSVSTSSQSLEKALSVPVLGDEEYARAFCKGYPSTKKFVISRGASADVAEEIAQAAWVTGWEHRSELRNPALICIWVNSIAKNMLFQHFEKSRRMDQLSTESAIVPRDSFLLDARTVLAKCCKADRDLLTTYYLEGRTAEEIAAATGVRPTTIRVRLLRIRRSLRTQVAGAMGIRTLPHPALVGLRSDSRFVEARP